MFITLWQTICRWTDWELTASIGQNFQDTVIDSRVTIRKKMSALEICSIKLHGFPLQKTINHHRDSSRCIGCDVTLSAWDHTFTVIYRGMRSEHKLWSWSEKKRKDTASLLLPQSTVTSDSKGKVSWTEMKRLPAEPSLWQLAESGSRSIRPQLLAKL